MVSRCARTRTRSPSSTTVSVIGHEVHVAAAQARHHRSEPPREIEIAQLASRNLAVRYEDPPHVQVAVTAIDPLGRGLADPGDDARYL